MRLQCLTEIGGGGFFFPEVRFASMTRTRAGLSPDCERNAGFIWFRCSKDLPRSNIYVISPILNGYSRLGLQWVAGQSVRRVRLLNSEPLTCSYDWSIPGSNPDTTGVDEGSGSIPRVCMVFQRRSSELCSASSRAFLVWMFRDPVTV